MSGWISSLSPSVAADAISVDARITAVTAAIDFTGISLIDQNNRPLRPGIPARDAVLE